MPQQFVSSYAKLLVKHPESIEVKSSAIDDGLDEIVIYAHEEDIGKLIGKEGKMIHAIKTVISGYKAKGGKNYRVSVQPVGQ
jgi:predicted RNA-binding protein YlqC (UPF0109 family)